MNHRISIAVVGMSGLFPGASDLNQFWGNILQKIDTTAEIPPDRWIIKPEFICDSDLLPDKAISKRACLIQNFNFNAEGIELNPALLDALDPLHRIVLHIGRQALLDCICPPNRERTGIVLASIALPTDASSAIAQQILGNAFEQRLFKHIPTYRQDRDPIPLTREQSLASCITGLPAALLANGLGLGAGSFTLDAACASTLYAVKLACDELHLHRADTMLAGGVSRPDCLYTQVGFSQLRALSPSGRCAPFDEQADGLVVGEGAGLMVLKRLEDALKDGDKIYGVIRGIGLSNDLGGNLLSPDSEGQVRAMAKAYQMAGWSVQDIDYIECHGTGTPTGDRVELQSLRTLWGESGWSKAQCAIGSVKSMIGHLLTAAGAAGMIKTLLALSHKTLPPSLNFHQAPVNSPLQNSPFRVQQDAEAWPRKDHPRRGAVSAFGFGGINGHLLIEEWPPDERKSMRTGFRDLLPDPRDTSQAAMGLHHPKKISNEKPANIAIVGMETLFGSITTLRGFQEALFNGTSIMGKRPKNRWKGCDTVAECHIENAASHGGYLSDFVFDYDLFHIPPKEIPDVLAQHLLMLKAAAGAMANAGLPLREHRPDMGVIIGMGFDFGATDFHLRWNLHHQVEQWIKRTDLGLHLPEMILGENNITSKWLESLKDESGPPLTSSRTLGALGGIIASRIAREFQFGGPSFTVSCEAVSGLKALQIASWFLQQGELNAALVGAVDLTGDVRNIVTSHHIRPFTHQPVIRPFDRHGDGSLPGEGAAAIVVKRLDDAIKNRDRIYAIIKGFGSSSNGGLDIETRANTRYIDAYQRSLHQALRQADIAPASLSMMETHGSGNPLEDQVESEALYKVFTNDRHKQTSPCAIGSAKAVLGHTGAAAGLASVIKTSLCLYQEIIPPLPSFYEPAHEENWPSDLFHLPAFPSYWVRNSKDGPRRAGICAMTPDGHVMHAIVQAHEDSTTDPMPAMVKMERKSPLGMNSIGLFCVESDTKDHLVKALENLKQEVILSDYRQLSIERAARFRYNTIGLNPSKKYAVTLLAKDIDQLTYLIEEAKNGISTNTPKQMTGKSGISYLPDALVNRNQIAFVYPGSGNHYVGMGQGIGIYWPEILREMDRESSELMSQLLPDCFVPYRSSWVTGWEQSVQDKIKSDPLNMIFAQVIYGSMVTRLMNRFGIKPSAVIGYSLGESSALFATGAWSDRDSMLKRMRNSDLFRKELAGPCHALRRAWNLPSETPVQWCVAVVNRDKITVCRAIEVLPYVRLLIVNTPDQCVIGGQRDQVNTAIKQLSCEAVFLDGVVTVHCDAVKPVASAYEALHVLPTTPPEGIRYYSCAEGSTFDLNSQTAAASIRKQAVSGFDFPATIEQAYQDGIRIFLEIGPHCSCTGMINSILGGKPHLALSASIRGEDEYLSVLKCIGTLISARVPVNLDMLYNDSTLPSQRENLSRQNVINLCKTPSAPTLPETTSLSVPEQYKNQPSEPTASQPMMTTSPGASDAPIHYPFASMIASLTQHMASTADAHEHFLRFSRDLSKAYADTVTYQSQLILKGATEKNRSSADPPPLTSLEIHTDGPLVLFPRDLCLEFARGSIAKVLGPDFAEVDTYPYRVRLPDEPLMLVDRILWVEGKKMPLGSGRVVTEHDVLPDAWYLDGGHAPVCISVEAGQADLFLCAYLGIDRVVKGKRVYRLLDATVTFYRGLPVPGEVIRYDITIEKFVRQGETYLFFFNFKGTIGSLPLITMTDGCAGFFTQGEIRQSGGIILTGEDTKPSAGKKPADWPNLVPLALESYDDAGVDALRKGDLSACFGPCFDDIHLSKSLCLPGGNMKLIDRVIELDPAGGRFSLGFIRAEADIHPDDWFLTCHFVDDRVMPGTLMYECCAHTLRIFLQRMGWVSDNPDACYEPVIGVQSTLKCRGPVTPDTHHVRYEVHIKEIGYSPEPYVLADAHMFADDLHIVTFKDMALKMSGVTRENIESLWLSRSKDSPAPCPAPLWDRHRLLAFCTGDPSEAFGEPYRPFNRDRFIARLPDHPFLFIDRITRIDPKPWVLAPDGWIEAEVDINAESWYFKANRIPSLPLVALLEIALQPCGWLAAYMGSALRSEKDLKFRNLGGTATLYETLSPEHQTLIVKAKLTSTAEAGEMIIEHFDFHVIHKNDRNRRVYTGQTNFGFFSPEAMAQQTGIRNGEKRCYTPNDREIVSAISDSFEDIHPLSPEDLAEDTESHRSIPAKALRMIDRIDAFIPDGGHKKLGFISGSKDVDPGEWFFKAHFYQDPVCPGSLGIESFIQLIRYVAFYHWKDLSDHFTLELLTNMSHDWTYRGQILPSNKKVEVIAEITDIREDPHPIIIADGFLKVDGLCIYEMKNFGLQFIPRS